MIPSKRLHRAIIGACLFILTFPAQAALIGVIPTEPDLTTNSLVTAYNHTSGGGPSSGGVLTIDGTLTGGATAGTYEDNDLGLNENVFVDYSLVAYFDNQGGFLSGTLDVQLVNGTALTGLGSDPEFLVKATLTGFGFSGSGASGFMDFTFNIITGGSIWSDEGYGPTGGIILTLSNLDPSLVGSWAQNNLLDSGDWITSGSGNFADTFTDNNITVVPVPAAIWLFGSGLFGLIGISRRRKAS